MVRIRCRGLGILLLLRATAIGAADDGAGKARDFFADEPVRPRVEVPVRFSGSWDEARAEASRGGRRILAYFSGKSCGWCRVMEKRTFHDAEVAERSRAFLCVEVDVGEEKNLRLADELRIDTIPRCMVLEPDGRILGRRTGYIPAEEFAAWLEAMRAGPAEPVDHQPAKPPPPVGAGEADADLTIWFVDANRNAGRWGDRDWTRHHQMLQVLWSAGLRPRVEHIPRGDFPARWEAAEKAGRLPGLLVPEKWAGLVRDLEQKGRLLSVHSGRLQAEPESASCTDLAGLWTYLAVGSAEERRARTAIDSLLKPGPETALPGAELPTAAARDEAAEVARRAAAGFLAGDVEALKAVASPSSPQLTRCTRPDGYRKGMAVSPGDVELRGNGSLAFARVEASFRGDRLIGADPVMVILRREESRWKAFAVSTDVTCLRELTRLCRLELMPALAVTAPPVPRLSFPADGGAIGTGDRAFAWAVPPGEPLAGQVCQVLLEGDKDASWPDTRVRLYPAAPRELSLKASDTAQHLTGMVGSRMSWCVWAIGQDGRIAVSEVRSYAAPKFAY